MAFWLDVAVAAAAINVLLLVGLGSVWIRSYRRVGATHTLGLVVFAAFLLVENGLWLYFYAGHPGFIGWFVGSGVQIQVGMTMLCGLELVALGFLARITWL